MKRLRWLSSKDGTVIFTKVGTFRMVVSGDDKDGWHAKVFHNRFEDRVYGKDFPASKVAMRKARAELRRICRDVLQQIGG